MDKSKANRLFNSYMSTTDSKLICTLTKPEWAKKTETPSEKPTEKPEDVVVSRMYVRRKQTHQYLKALHQENMERQKKKPKVGFFGRVRKLFTKKSKKDRKIEEDPASDKAPLTPTPQPGKMDAGDSTTEKASSSSTPQPNKVDAGDSTTDKALLYPTLQPNKVDAGDSTIV